MTPAEILRGVVAAHERGDRVAAERLGEQWMRGYTGDRIAGGGPCQLRERTHTTKLRRPHTPVRVLLEPQALDAISRTACWWTGEDGLEVGGGLFGINWGEQVLVTHANGCRERAKRARSHPELDERSFRHFDSDEHVRWIGGWHSHTGTSSSNRPSRCDLEAFRSSLSFMRAGSDWQPFHVELILTGENGWARPTIHGWILDRDDNLESATVRAL